MLLELKKSNLKKNQLFLGNWYEINRKIINFSYRLIFQQICVHDINITANMTLSFKLDHKYKQLGNIGMFIIKLKF